MGHGPATRPASANVNSRLLDYERTATEGGARDVVAAPLWMSVDWGRHVRQEVVAGRRMTWVDYGEGPAVVLVHGLGGSWQTWLENLPALARDHRVIAVDLPGFGGSEPLPSPGELSGHVDTLAELLDALRIDRALVVGHSMGGLVALLFAAAHIERLYALALVGSGGIVLGPRRLAAIVRGFLLFNAVFKRPGVARAFARRPRLRHRLLALAVHDPSALSGRLAAEIIPLMAAPGFADAVVSAARVAEHVPLDAVTCPTLLVWGRQDRILPVARAEELAEALPDAHLEIIDRAGHCPMFERPAELNALLLAFAAEHRS